MTWQRVYARGFEAYQRDVEDGHLSVLLSTDDGAVHMSISHRIDGPLGQPLPGRYPSWDEIVEARYAFTPADAHMVMVLPPREEYVNVHATTFHLWQSKENWS